MLQLVAEGPELPEELLEALDNERLVFFCGAGISLPTGLPTFSGLVDHVWNRVQPVLPKTGAEEAALKDKQYDRFLGLLEQRLVPGTVRRHVIECLLAESSSSCTNHRSILDLAAIRKGGYRIVTTNFDHRFIESGCDKKNIDSSPKLPIPKPSTWTTLVHIHGLIDAVSDPAGGGLVLTTADFGRAYLTEGWASRFLTELFREFTVVFIGYSIDDPIVSYLMIALAGERSQTTQFRTAFAFADFDSTKQNEQSSRKALWESKGVVPILYDKKNDHCLLWDTLSEWSKIKRAGQNYRSNIISACAGVPPKGTQDLLSKQVCWALNDDSGRTAKTFSTLPESAPLEWWLEIFDTIEVPLNHCNRLTAKLTELPTSISIEPTSTQPAKNPLVRKDGAFNHQLHPVTLELARWLCNHLSDERLLDWTLSNGGFLHPQWRTLIKQALFANRLTDESLQTAWETLISNVRYHQFSEDFWPITDRTSNKKDSECNLSRKLELLDSLFPILRLKRSKKYQPDESALPSVRKYLDGALDIVGSDSHGSSLLVQGISDHLLAECAFDLTYLLKRSMDLLRLVGKADSSDDGTHLALQSISDHPQNENSEPWTRIIKLTRDSFALLYKLNPSEARSLLKLWSTLPYPIFQRLLLHSVTQFKSSNTNLACDVLLQKNSQFLWSIATRRECLRFLRKSGSRISVSKLSLIQKAILSGPPTSKFREDLSEQELSAAQERSIWTRLKKLSISNARLSNQTTATLAKLESKHGFPTQLSNDDELLFVMGEWEWESKYEEVDTRTLDTITPSQLVLSEQKYLGVEYVASTRPHVIRRNLLLIDTRTISTDYWNAIVNGLVQFKTPRRQRYVWYLFKPIFLHMPNSVLGKLIVRLSEWLRGISIHLTQRDIADFLALWKRIWIQVPQTEVQSFETVLITAINHPAGKLTESIVYMMRLIKSDRRDEGLPNEFRKVLSEISKGNTGITIVSKTILGADLAYLFWLDEKWTTKEIINSMNWDNPTLSSGIWSGYLWQLRIYPDLVLALKPSLFGLFKHWTQFSAAVDYSLQTRLFKFLSLALTDGKSCFVTEEINQLGPLLGASNLGRLGHCLAERLAAQELPNVMWFETVKPLLLELWPSDDCFQNDKSSEGLSRIVISTAAAFPDAVAFCRPFIRKTDNFESLLRKINQAELGKQHPQQLTTLLAALIPASASIWKYDELPTILDSIRTSWAGCEDDCEFQYLSSLLETRVGPHSN